VEVTEDRYPLHDIRCFARLPQTAESVRLLLSVEELPFESGDDHVEFIVPPLLCHQMVEINC
jgi:hypothetical protein